MDYTAKLRLLRENMQKHALAAYIQPVHDAYMSEYPPECNRRVQWLCGFSGSAGAVVVTAEKAVLFTDGRYTLQAKAELPEGLYESQNSGSVSPEMWLAQHVPAGSKVGYDPMLYTEAMLKRMGEKLAHAELMPVPNLVDGIWGDRPAHPATPLMVHPGTYSGSTPAEKCAQTGNAIRDAGADYALLATPDSVCWLLDLRARDVENTPLLLAAALVGADGSAECFVDPARADNAVRQHLGAKVTLSPPEVLPERLREIGVAGGRVICDPQSVPSAYTRILGEAGAKLVSQPDPCLLPKACKNTVQLQGIRAAHHKDGVAVAKLLYWLDSQPPGSVRESEVCERLLSLRQQQDEFVEPSFPTISGSGPNGAIVHYRVSEQSDRVLQAGELFLLDSGGQYLSGTTDITRTIVIGEPSGEQRDRFTRVLRGHIALALAVFPQGTTGGQLDALARQYLWQAGLDYDHGTGHGVGQFLGVHEGPQRISKRGGDVAIREGMIVSNEPGYYKTGEYGIRIENLVAATSKPHGGGQAWLGFETLTCVPIDTRLVEAGMLSPGEKEWLNAYHAWVLATLSPHMHKREQAWLEKACAPV